MKRAVIVYRFLPQYRVEFYDQLRERLRADGVTLDLYYGDGDPTARAKADLVDIDWAHRVPNKIVRLAGAELYWQPVLKQLRGADLVIVEQASRLLLNYLLQFGRIVGGTKVAFWGHGRNFQAKPENAVAEWLKRRYSRHVDWWFSYNDLSTEIVKSFGFPEDRITTVHNAIDTTQIRDRIAGLSATELRDIRDRHDLGPGPVGLYVGALYEEKRLEFLIDAATSIRIEEPGFQLVIAGDGPQRGLVQRAASEKSWLKYVGPKFGHDKSDLLAVATLFLMPGAVGLAILDAFAAGLPFITAHSPHHGPEVAYLDDGVNGMMTEASIAAYAATVVGLLKDDRRMAELRAGAVASSFRYSVENMVANFASGVISAIS